jgi:hypothetical protein
MGLLVVLDIREKANILVGPSMSSYGNEENLITNLPLEVFHKTLHGIVRFWKPYIGLEAHGFFAYLNDVGSIDLVNESYALAKIMIGCTHQE